VKVTDAKITNSMSLHIDMKVTDAKIMWPKRELQQGPINQEMVERREKRRMEE
jgi:hypothetical protein